jgi:hypothetical protein
MDNEQAMATTKKIYRIYFEALAEVGCVIEVQAESSAEAAELALDRVLGGDGFWEYECTVDGTVEVGRIKELTRLSVPDTEKKGVKE